MKKSAIIFTIIITALLFSTIGLSQNHKQELVRSYAKMANSMAVNEEVTYVNMVARDDEILGENYAGDYLYENTQYSYLVEPKGGYVEAIFPQIDDENTVSKNKSSLVILDTENKVLDYFSGNFGDIIKGDLKIVLYPRLDGTKTYEVIEMVNDLETGTKGSISLDEKDVLISAAFIKGNYDAIAQIDPRSLISQDIAFENALDEVSSYENSTSIEVLEGNYQAELKTFKNTVYWVINFQATIAMDSQTEVSQFYEIKVDALTGAVIDIAEAV